MAIHELYIGGPANTSNPVGNMFPKPTFSSAVKSAPAGHRGSVMFSLSRDFHFDKEREGGVSTLQYFNGKIVSNGDDLGLVVIPEKTLLYLVHVDILGGAPGVTASLRLRNGNNFAPVDFSLDSPTSFVLNAFGEVLSGLDNSYYQAEGCCPQYFAVSNLIDLRIISTPDNNEIAGTFNRTTRIRISPVIVAPLAGGP